MDYHLEKQMGIEYCRWGNIFKVEARPSENYELALGNLNLKWDKAIIRTKNKIGR